MKYVFPCKEAKLESVLFEKFGRAPGFAIFNDEDESLIFIENTQMNAGHGAGIQAGQTVVAAGANVVCAQGPIGPKAMEVLQQANITTHTDLGNLTIQEALNKIRS